MLSGKQDGNETLKPGTDVRYFITAKHLVWIWQDKAKSKSVLAQEQQGDPLRAYMDAFGAGAGSYKRTGNSLAVTIEQWQDPEYIGHSLDFTIKVEGNRLYQSFKYPILENGKKIREALIEEAYERLE